MMGPAIGIGLGFGRYSEVGNRLVQPEGHGQIGIRQISLFADRQEGDTAEHPRAVKGYLRRPAPNLKIRDKAAQFFFQFFIKRQGAWMF